MNIEPAATWMEKILMSAAVLTCSGQYQVTIENYKSIRTLTEEMLEIQATGCMIRVKGKNIKLKYFTRDVMKITGRIESIEYVD